MDLRLTDTGPRLTSKDIKRFEKQRGVTLPDDYRAFLLKSNGGYPDVDVAFSFREGGRPSDSVLSQFYPLDKGSEDSNLDEVYEMFVEAGRMPPNLVPIGDDAFGNQICLSVAGKDAGAVYFWDHEREPDPARKPVVFRNLSLIADSFSDFLASLEPMEETD